MNYAYLSSGGILHVTNNKENANNTAKYNRVIETEIESLRGYPAVTYEDTKYPLMVYSIGEAYLIINSNIYSRKRVKLEDYPEVYNIYINLTGVD